jgi:hypothetical protein
VLQFESRIGGSHTGLFDYPKRGGARGVLVCVDQTLLTLHSQLLYLAVFLRACSLNQELAARILFDYPKRGGARGVFVCVDQTLLTLHSQLLYLAVFLYVQGVEHIEILK